jgi:acyl carrier protein
MKAKIKNVMSAIFQINESELSTNPSSTTIEIWDSLNHMNLIVALEEEFNIQFSDDEIVRMTSFEEIEKTLIAKL